MRKAIYAGTFDPPTVGHEWMIKQGAKLFDKLVVAVLKNPNKKTLFSLEERIEMLKEAAEKFGNVEVDFSENEFLAEYARQKEAGYNLRGVRNADDYKYEAKMFDFNENLNPGLVPVLLYSPHELSTVSSSAVREAIGYNGWKKVIKPYLSEKVYARLMKKFGGKE